ncbi:hypothetical protein [Aureimonas sp. AU20]|uniref:hypothetical protein n=1 Tax=Aureimonas sp. AU20 TaxID=1349819 RepID=UPI00071F9A51|nr:hypothetical protein [Aureimonas sp. AU20]ALN73565.1 hypothetical protein M673_12625 [Aureimonas sp. AU20]
MSMIRFPDTAFSLDRHDKTTKRIEDKDHLAFIRTLPSVVSFQTGVEACHIRFGEPLHRKPKTAGGRKPDDWHVLPLTPEEHREQHSMNERHWWTRQGFTDPVGVALKLYEVTGQFNEAIEIIRAARREARR